MVSFQILFNQWTIIFALPFTMIMPTSSLFFRCEDAKLVTFLSHTSKHWKLNVILGERMRVLASFACLLEGLELIEGMDQISHKSA